MAGELEIVAIVTAVVTSVASLVIAILTYLLNRRQARDLARQIRQSGEQTAMYAKRLEIAEKQLETNQTNLKLIEKGVTAMMAIAESQKKQVGALLRQTERGGTATLEKAINTLEKRLSESEFRATKDAIVQEREIALKEQRALADKQRANWNILAGVAKALGWAYDRGLLRGDEADDEGDDEA